MIFQLGVSGNLFLVLVLFLNLLITVCYMDVFNLQITFLKVLKLGPARFLNWVIYVG